MTISRFLAMAVGIASTAFLAMPVLAQSPYTSPDDTWISLNGTVADVRPDEFTLDYGEGFVVVEMDDGDRDADAYTLLEGDSVSVAGKIDDDFFETTTIEASSVHVEDIDTTFRASAVDEEDPLATMIPQVDVPRAVLRGVVSDVREGEFVLNTGLRAVTVNVENLPENPLDDEGYLQIEVGDRVNVNGNVTVDFFEGREMVAENVVEVMD